MTRCNRCKDPLEYEWYQDHMDKWHLGIKLDVNNYRIHKCNEKIVESKCKYPARQGWIKFTCICGCLTWLSKKHFSDKELNLTCNECRYA